MNTLVVLNDPPYGSERSCNGPRRASALAKREGEHVRVFLMADAIGCAGQRTPNGYSNLERLICATARHGAEIGLCGTCMDARGVDDAALCDGSRRSSLDELADWTIWADKVVSF